MTVFRAEGRYLHFLFLALLFILMIRTTVSLQSTPISIDEILALQKKVNGTIANVDELTEPNGTLIDPCQRLGDLSVDSQACLGCGGGMAMASIW